MLKTLMVGALILTTTFPATAQANFNTKKSDLLIAQKYNAYVCTSSANGRLSLRYGPGQGYQKIVEIPNGYGVSWVDSTTGDDGYTWLFVYYGDTSGWVRGDYICTN
jgi:uncharacterized protein YraI